MQLLMAILIILFAASAASSAQTIPCQASTAKTRKLRERVIEIDTAQNADAVAFRTELGINSDTSQVSIVTADSVCDAVTRAVNLVSLTTQTSALYVVRFGNLYAACVSGAGDLSSVYILDDHYVVKDVLVGT
jgi:Ni2+-binding GTPase involved in maturation of urease and hydrogenase